MTADGATAAPTVGLSHRQIQVVFVGLMLGMLLAALDQTIVATALPTIVGELGGQDKLAWVVTSYLLTSTASTPLWGKISDLYGRKSLFQAAIATFLVGSVLIGLSQNIGTLIGFRAVQGLGAGGLMSLAQAIIGDIVSPRERGRYQGYMGSVFAVSSVAGPLLGGFFVDHLSWRWCFYVNLPIGLVALVVTTSVLNLPFTRHEHRVDYLGASLLVAAVTPILLFLEWGGREYEWGSPTIIGLAAVGAVMTVMFLWRESRAEEPIVPLRLFRNDVFSVASGASFIIGAAMFGAIIFMPQYMQIVRGHSPTESGLMMLPMMVGLMLTSISSGRYIARTGRYKRFPIVGMSIMTVGLYLLSFLDTDTGFLQQSASIFVVGFGIGMVMQVLVLATQNAVDQRDLGTATATVTFFRSMGGAMGVAIFGAIQNNRLDHHIPRLLAERLPAGARDQIGPATGDLSKLLGSPEAIRDLSTRFPGPVGQALQSSVIDGFASALHVVFLTAIPLALCGLVVVMFLRERELRSSAHIGTGPAVGDDLTTELQTLDADRPAPRAVPTDGRGDAEVDRSATGS
ncbi:MAG TPA: MDR family MFS transporter [Acidimicrobiales bacterium]|nr:MDR family MFS transporter [Acidimicrobiales bacterium]